MEGRLESQREAQNEHIPSPDKKQHYKSAIHQKKREIHEYYEALTDATARVCDHTKIDMSTLLSLDLDGVKNLKDTQEKRVQEEAELRRYLTKNNARFVSEQRQSIENIKEAYKYGDSPVATAATMKTFDSNRGRSFTEMSAKVDQYIPPVDVETMFQRTVRVPGNKHLILHAKNLSGLNPRERSNASQLVKHYKQMS